MMTRNGGSAARGIQSYFALGDEPQATTQLTPQVSPNVNAHALNQPFSRNMREQVRLKAAGINIEPTVDSSRRYVHLRNFALDIQSCRAKTHEFSDSSPVTPANHTETFRSDHRSNAAGSTPFCVSQSLSTPSVPPESSPSPSRSSPPTSQSKNCEALSEVRQTASLDFLQNEFHPKPNVDGENVGTSSNHTRVEMESVFSPRFPIACKKRPRAPAYGDRKNVGSPALHSFFVHSAAAIVAAKTSAASVSQLCAKRPCISYVEAAQDPWLCRSLATQHVNYSKPAALSNTANASQGLCGVLAEPRRLACLSSVWVPSSTAAENKVAACSDQFHATETASTDFYRNGLLLASACLEEYENVVSELNKAALDELIGWLSRFFSDRGMTTDAEARNPGSESHNSAAYFGCGSDAESETQLSVCDVGNVVLITGDIGAGKSSIVFRAAKQLSLSILEINSATCRTGKRVREIVGDAVASHRIRSSSRIYGKHDQTHVDVQVNGTVPLVQNAGCNSLVVLEDVDVLFSDERGFWTSVIELAGIAGNRRPLVLTARSFTAEMHGVFGDSCFQVEKQLQQLLVPSVDFRASFLGQSGASPFQNYKHIHIPSQSPEKMHSILKSVSKRSRILKSPICVRTLTGGFGNGDIRGALNAMHFWGLIEPASHPGHAGSVIAGGLVNGAWRTDTCMDTFIRLQEAAWTGNVEDSADRSCVSLVYAKFRACSNVGKFRRQDRKMTGESRQDDEYMTLACWADLLDAVSLGNLIHNASSFCHEQRYNRTCQSSIDFESGFGGPAGSLHVATALEYQSFLTLSKALDCESPHLATDSDSIVWRMQYTEASLTSRSGERLSLPCTRVPFFVTAKRTCLTETLPMLSRFMRLGEKETSEQDHDGTSCEPIRITRSASVHVARKHTPWSGLNEAVAMFVRNRTVLSSGTYCRTVYNMPRDS